MWFSSCLLKVFKWQVWKESVKPGFTWSVSIFMDEVMSVFSYFICFLVIWGQQVQIMRAAIDVKEYLHSAVKRDT